jgi:hypothetical protein
MRRAAAAHECAGFERVPPRFLPPLGSRSSGILSSSLSVFSVEAEIHVCIALQLVSKAVVLYARPHDGSRYQGHMWEPKCLTVAGHVHEARACLGGGSL